MKFLYWLPCTDEDKELAFLEAAILIDDEVQSSFVFSENLIDIKNTAFLKLCGKILCKADSFAKLLEIIKSRNFDFDQFKIIIHKSRFQKKEIKNRIEAVVSIADAIKDGYPNLEDPKIKLDVISDGVNWYFLERQGKSENNWQDHIHKPHNFSSSLSARYCRALVNIALPNGGKLLDPCCGYGNLLVESAFLGIESIGNDWSELHLKCTKKNLAHFNLNAKLFCQDALGLNIIDVDAVVVDYPYNINSLTPTEFYKELANYFLGKAKTFLCLTVEPIECDLSSMGYLVKAVAVASKGEFKRYITLCNSPSTF